MPTENEHEWMTKKQVIDNPKYPFSKGQIDFLMSQRHLNNLAKAVRKIGKVCYFRRDLFEAWIESHQEKKG